MSSASLCQAHIGLSGSWHSIQKQTATDYDLPTYKKKFGRDPFGWKTFCEDWCRQLFSSIFSSAQHVCSVLFSSWQELRKTAWCNILDLFASDGRTLPHRVAEGDVFIFHKKWRIENRLPRAMYPQRIHIQASFLPSTVLAVKSLSLTFTYHWHLLPS